MKAWLGAALVALSGVRPSLGAGECGSAQAE